MLFLSQAGPPSWEFEVSGRLIERSESEGTAAAPVTAAPLPGSAAALGAQSGSSGPRFSSLIRRLTIRLDPEQYPDDGVITWSKALHEGPAKEKFNIRWLCRLIKPFTASTRVVVSQGGWVPPHRTYAWLCTSPTSNICKNSSGIGQYHRTAQFCLQRPGVGPVQFERSRLPAARL